MTSPASTQVLCSAEEALARHGRVALAQVVGAQGSTPGKVGWKLLVPPSGEPYGNLGGGAFEAMVVADARARLAERRPRGEVKRYYLTEDAVKGQPTGMVCGGMLEVFLEVLAAAPVLAIFGGGPVGQAVARAGELAGFDLLVADDRSEYSRPELFPPSARLVEVDRSFGGDLFAGAEGREVYATVVSRCWETDTAALAALLERRPERLVYVGLMGSRRKIQRVREELDRLGVDLSGIPLHAPIGLPLGGDSPGEIALSILAQIQRTRYEVE
jgi:xanthine dehydrogenase accessory factor